MDEKSRCEALSEFWFCLRCMQKRAVYPDPVCPACQGEGEAEPADNV